MATDPRRLMSALNTGVVPVQRMRTTAGQGVPEAAKLAAERANMMPPPAFDVAVRDLARPAPLSQEGIQRLRTVATLGAPNPVPVRVNPETGVGGGFKAPRPQRPAPSAPDRDRGQDRPTRIDRSQARASRLDRVREILANRPRPNPQPRAGLLAAPAATQPVATPQPAVSPFVQAMMSRIRRGA